MTAYIGKGVAIGTVTPPPSKSISHRAIICACLSDGVSVIENISDCDDVLATVGCFKALGADIEIQDGRATVKGIGTLSNKREILDCGDSGSSLRFLIPLLLNGDKTYSLHLGETLSNRPLTVYEKLCRENGFMFSVETTDDGAVLTLSGDLKSGNYTVDGSISSQFISGLLFALPMKNGDSRIIIQGKTESLSYINMTVDILSLFGVKVIWENENTLFIKGSQSYHAADMSVECDLSASAFFEALNYIGSDVKVNVGKVRNIQGDGVYNTLFSEISNTDRTIRIPVIDISDCPDLAPILFVLASAKGETLFTGTKRLAYKESPRDKTMADELSAFGIDSHIEENSVRIMPRSLHAPSRVLNSQNDHRIAMALSVLLTLTGGELDGAEACSKSYPRFFDDLKGVGIHVELKN